MKILKIVVISLLLIAGIYLLVGAFMNPVIHVESQIGIQKSPEMVFEQINNLQNWKHWSYWDNIDPNMKSSFSGPEAGEGAVHSWESKNDSVGNGSMAIVKSVPGQLVETKLTFEGMGDHMGGWKIEPEGEGVKVTAWIDMNTGILFRPLMAMMGMKKVLEEDFGRSLSGLKSHCESLPEPEPEPESMENSLGSNDSIPATVKGN
jgi:hypothetical protein